MLLDEAAVLAKDQTNFRFREFLVERHDRHGVGVDCPQVGPTGEFLDRRQRPRDEPRIGRAMESAKRPLRANAKLGIQMRDLGPVADDDFAKAA